MKKIFLSQINPRLYQNEDNTIYIHSVNTLYHRITNTGSVIWQQIGFKRYILTFYAQHALGSTEHLEN
jgi:hypothetical protein